jgi:hypothetical protein
MSNNGFTKRYVGPAFIRGKTNIPCQLDGRKAADSGMCFFQGKPVCCADRQFGADWLENAKNQKKLDFFFTKNDKIAA